MRGTSWIPGNIVRLITGIVQKCGGIFTDVSCHGNNNALNMIIHVYRRVLSLFLPTYNHTRMEYVENLKKI